MQSDCVPGWRYALWLNLRQKNNNLGVAVISLQELGICLQQVSSTSPAQQASAHIRSVNPQSFYQAPCIPCGHSSEESDTSGASEASTLQRLVIPSPPPMRGPYDTCWWQYSACHGGYQPGWAPPPVGVCLIGSSRHASNLLCIVLFESPPGLCTAQRAVALRVSKLLQRW